MIDIEVSLVIAGSAITAAISIFMWVVNALVAARNDALTRRREMFSKALAACARYREFPYVIGRRGTDSELERKRISTELREIQADIAYYSAWIATESSDVSNAFDELVGTMRRVAGSYMRDAWEREPIDADPDMNISDIDLSALDC
ncbi:MAG: hypothetical protein F4Z40_08425, partial [Chloroflexi bacterium]|nr:hypothetical protein [Chloroflexota bacterium]